MSNLLATDHVDLQYIGEAMSYIIPLVELFSVLRIDLRQIINYDFKSVPVLAHEPSAGEDVVWSSSLFELQVGYGELKNLKLKQYDCSKSGLVSRRRSFEQHSRCVDFQAKYQSVLKALNRCFDYNRISKL